MEFSELIKIPQIEKVTILKPFHKPLEGTICITSHHLIFSARKEDIPELWILYRNIDYLERHINQNESRITLKCKNLQIIHLYIPNQEDCIKASDSIECLSNLDDTKLLYPFFYNYMESILEDGWTAFGIETEFPNIVKKSDDWRISYVNKDFKICSSYPEALIVPKVIDDELIQVAGSFRKDGRFPVLAYRHDSGAALLRSSQPLVGSNGRRCKEDEKLLNSTLRPGKKAYIIDTRSTNQSQQAKNKGGGYELEAHYPQWKRINKPGQPHSSLLDSLTKLVEACNDVGCAVDKWLSRLEGSGWLGHIKDILDCACLAAQCLDKEATTVLVHGTDGTDLTLQVTSLAQVILDLDCRTVRGFEALIEREWIQAGHPFFTRTSHTCYTPGGLRSRLNIPTFLMFLDGIWQMMFQFPCSFQFNENFLIMLFEHAYSSQFGTFLCDNEKERRQCNLRRSTVSLWSYINRPDILQDYLNPLYEPNNQPLWPSVAPASLELWGGLFLRWSVGQQATSETSKKIQIMKESDKKLRSRAIKLRKQLQDLEREALLLQSQA